MLVDKPGPHDARTVLCYNVDLPRATSLFLALWLEPHPDPKTHNGRGVGFLHHRPGLAIGRGARSWHDPLDKSSINVDSEPDYSTMKS